MKKLLKIRDIDIWPNVVLSPMSGVTDASFRRVVRELAGGRVGMLVSEFVSVDGASRLEPSQVKQMRFFPEERPFCMQLFGANPERMGWGAKQAEQAGADFIEVNCGCPVPKVVGRGGGAGLLRDLPKLAHILREMRRNIRVPLLVKARIGWDESTINVLETLDIVQSEGAELFTIHGRTRSQGYRGLADWDLIGEVAAKATIPVAGSGDVRSPEEAEMRLREYPVSAVGIGRAAMHNPWIFAMVADHWEGKAFTAPSAQMQHAFFMRYQLLLREDGFNDHRILGRSKQIASRLVRALGEGATDLRITLLRTQSLPEFNQWIDQFYLNGIYEQQGFRFEPHRLQSLNAQSIDEVVPGTQW